MEVLNVYSPYDQSLIETINMHTAEEAEHMLDTAVALYKDYRNGLSQQTRIDILEKLALLVEAEQEEFAALIAKEGGKPLIDAKIEVTRAIDGIRLAIEELPVLMIQKEVPMGRTPASANKKAYTTYEPIGVVVAISAFNHPLNLIVHQVIPAIAVGCPVIIKPAATTPLNCRRLVELIHQAGLPKEWCQLCICSNETAEMLATSPKIGFLTFIGSARIGWMLKSKLAPGVRCALEHGGVAPAIIDKTADLTKAIPSLAKGGFYHAGQVCVSTQRIFVHESLIDEVTEKLVQAADILKVGDPSNQETEVGPLILPKEVDRVDTWVQEAISAGAILITGGKKLSDTTYAPTILRDPPVTTKLSTQEIFGPVIALYTYTDIKEAINQANSLDYAFQASIFTKDKAIEEECIKALDATAVMVNDHTAFRVDWMPFAGRKLSGYGVGGIGHTMHDMVQLKMTVTNKDT